jgi:rSAM/selenodomain-associated transferase 1
MSHPFQILDCSRTDLAFSGRCAFTVMAKAPIPGKVKTRLSPPLTAAQAADLNACFLRDTVANLSLAASQVSAEVVISYTPVGEEAAFVGVLPPGTLLLPQRGDSFGERLLASAEDLFACGFGSVCLIDSDSPTVPTGEFVRAAQVLGECETRAVLGPSADGGYYLIGMQRAEPNLFDRITWSTEQVCAETLDRAREIELAVSLLNEWYDVDDAFSLDRLQQELRESPLGWRGYPAPHSRAYLRELDQVRSKSKLAEALA